MKSVDALTTYQELSSATQQANKTAQEFLIRLIILRQKTLFTSQEDKTLVKYDYQLVQNTFLWTLGTGLNESLKNEMRVTLENPNVTDEDLMEALNKAMTVFEKRVQEPTKIRANEIKSTVKEETKDNPKSNEDKVFRDLAVGLAELRATVAQLGEKINNSQTRDSRTSRPRKQGCQTCQESGELCNHCFKCGGANHYA